MLLILKRLIKGSFVYGIGKILPGAVGLFLIPVYTRFLTTSDYGIVAVATSVSSIFGIIFGMGLRGAVTRNYFDYAEDPDEIKGYLGTIAIFFLLIGFTFTVALTIFGKPIFDFLLSRVSFYPYIALSLWTAFFGAGMGIILSLYRAQEQAVRYVSIQIGKFLISIGLIIYFVVTLHQGALGKIKGGFFAGLIFFVLFLILISRESKFSFSRNKLHNALMFGLPLVPHLLSGWVLAAADRLLLERMASLSEVGLYNLGYQLGLVMSFVVFSINSAWTPIFYDTAKNKKYARIIFSKMFTVYTVFVSTLAASIILFSKEVILILAAEAFHKAYLVVPAVAVGYLFQGLYFMSVTPIFYKKKTYVMPLLTGFAAASNIGLNLLWIPKFGMMGAAYATTLSFALLCIATHIFAQRFYRIPYEYVKVAIMGALLSGIYLLNYFWDFQGIVIPIMIKIGMLLVFITGIFLFKIISFKELRKLKILVNFTKTKK